MKKILLGLLQLYRYLFSSWLGRHCRFEPSCSRYAREAVEKYGAGTGSWMAVRRLSRCHPWCAGGYDPVP
jgi:uncharacterized protein